MNRFKRVFVIVCDSMGIGNGKDASLYNDKGSNTFKHIDEKVRLNTPELDSLGIGLICDVKNHHSNKLLFRYNNKNFNKLINLI